MKINRAYLNVCVMDTDTDDVISYNIENAIEKYMFNHNIKTKNIINIQERNVNSITYYITIYYKG